MHERIRKSEFGVWALKPAGDERHAHPDEESGRQPLQDVWMKPLGRAMANADGQGRHRPHRQGRGCEDDDWGALPSGKAGGRELGEIPPFGDEDDPEGTHECPPEGGPAARRRAVHLV